MIDGVYEQSQRIYDSYGQSPTLTTQGSSDKVTKVMEHEDI